MSRFSSTVFALSPRAAGLTVAREIAIISSASGLIIGSGAAAG
jgi:hypothetical protein